MQSVMYCSTESAKLTPDPPATRSTVENSPQRARAADPQGPSTSVRRSTPRGGATVPAGSVSPGAWLLPRAIMVATLSQRRFVHPFFARMRNTSSRPSSFGASWSQIVAFVNGCVVHREIAGHCTRKCWPGAHDRYPGVISRRRMVRPGSSSACAKPGGGTYLPDAPKESFAERARARSPPGFMTGLAGVLGGYSGFRRGCGDLGEPKRLVSRFSGAGGAFLTGGCAGVLEGVGPRIASK